MKKQSIILLILFSLLMNQNASGISFVSPALDSLCPGGNYVQLGTIFIREDSVGEFASLVVSNIVFTLPPGYEFLPNMGQVDMNGSNLLSVYSVNISATTISFGIINNRSWCTPFFNPPSCSQTAEIEIRNLRVRAVSQAPPGYLFRTSGTTNILGDNIIDSVRHASFSTRTVFAPTINGSNSICPNGIETLSLVTGSDPVDDYDWSTGSDSSTTVIIAPGTYTATVTYNGCSVTAPPFVVVQDSAAPPHFIPDALFALCDSFTVTIVADTMYSTYEWDSFPGVITNTLTVDSEGVYILTVVDSNGCESSGAATVFQDSDTPPIDYFGPQIPCDGEEVYLASAGGVVYHWYRVGDTTWFSDSTVAIVTETGDYEVVIQTENGCWIRSNSRHITFQELPTVDFDVSGLCINDTIFFHSTSEPGDSDAISNWIWNFGGTYYQGMEDTANVYLTPGDKFINLTIETVNGCEADSHKIITIGARPTVDFSWSGLCHESETDFFNFSTITSGDTIAEYLWEFGGSVTATDTHPQYVFPDTGYHSIILTATTTRECAVSDTNRLYILKVVESYPYIETFEVGTGGWFTSGELSSWFLGIPWGSPAPAGPIAWATGENGAYNDNEQSALYSPCFDLGTLFRPMMAFENKIETEFGDGVSLQYSIDDGDSWFHLGEPGDGIHWHNATSILGLPGGFPIGWSLDSTGWRSSRIKLDPLSGSPEYVRFRFAIGADANNTDKGIAIDSFRIRSREKYLLLEEFTNSSNIPDFYSDAQLNALIDDNMNDMLGIFYHVPLINLPADPFYLLEPNDVTARQLYYPNTTPPWSILDGNRYFGSAFPTQGITQEMIDTLILEDPLFTIESLTMSNCNGTTPINVSAIVSYQGDTTMNHTVVVQVVIIEREVTGITGANGQTTFQWVMKKMLPGQPGTSLPVTQINPGMTFPVSQTWGSPHAYNCQQLGAIVFIQDPVTQRVYQSDYVGPDGPGSTLSDPFQQSDSNFDLFPNPVGDYLTVRFHNQLPSDLVLFDLTGAEKVRWESPGESFSFSVQQFSNGIYFLKAEFENGVVTKKVIVAR